MSPRAAALPVVAIMGYGKVGRTLARAFFAAGYPLRGVVVRRPTGDGWLAVNGISQHLGLEALTPEVDFLCLCLRDGELKDAALKAAQWRGCREGLVVAHTAGAQSALALSAVKERGALTLAFHPLQTFTGDEGPELLNGVTFGLDGDEPAVELGESIARRFGGIPRRVLPHHRALYHLGGVFACNLMAALVGASADLLTEAGFSPSQANEALEPLLSATVRNIARRGLPDALTGPLSRGDAQTIAKHLDILRDHPRAESIYLLLSADLMERLKSRLTEEQWRALNQLLKL